MGPAAAGEPRNLCDTITYTGVAASATPIIRPCRLNGKRALKNEYSKLEAVLIGAISLHFPNYNSSYLKMGIGNDIACGWCFSSTIEIQLPEASHQDTGSARTRAERSANRRLFAVRSEYELFPADCSCDSAMVHT